MDPTTRRSVMGFTRLYTSCVYDEAEVLPGGNEALHQERVAENMILEIGGN